jgi:serine protease Do
LNSTRALQWLSVLLLAVLAGQARGQPSETIISRGPAVPAAAMLALPAPAPDRSQDVPAAFRQAAPVSMADLRAMQQYVQALVPKISPAVVAVTLDRGEGSETVASGSGVVISADGLVLTAGHVCQSPNRPVRFKFADGKTAFGKTVGLDEETDTGLTRITDAGPWPYAALGDLKEARLGDWVLALGHPGGFDPKRSLVVRLGRIIRQAPGILQTDCTISPGDSGGPLFDMQGRVIGIHTAISSSTSENFHVAIPEFYDTWKVLTGLPVAPPAPRRPLAYSGAIVVNDAEGCRLTAIEKGSPAAKAGLQVNDVVLKVEGRTIVASASFDRWIAESGPGQILNLQIKRGGKILPFKLQLQAQPQAGPDKL